MGVKFDFAFDGIPQRLNVVQVGRISWQRQQCAADLCQQTAKRLVAMKRSVIQDHHLSCFQNRAEFLSKP